jgi:periplasmic protein CpxP/Spy
MLSSNASSGSGSDHAGVPSTAVPAGGSGPSGGSGGGRPSGGAPRGGWSRRWKIAGISAAVVGVLTLGACSHAGHRGWAGGPGMAGPADPERAAQFAEKMADRLVSRVDGTPEQRQRIAGIAQGATTDLLPLREQARATRLQSIELLRAPTVDRAGIEALRVEQLRLADAASKRLAQAIGDAAEVLTPEQRAKLAERMAARRGWRS